MSQKNCLPVLHKHGAHPQSIHLASTAMSKNPLVPIVGVKVSMCVCVLAREWKSSVCTWTPFRFAHQKGNTHMGKTAVYYQKHY